MLYEAALACTNSMTEEEIAEGRVFPNLKRIRLVSKAVAVAVIQQAWEDGLTTKITAHDVERGLDVLVSRKMYFPGYVPLVDPRR